MRKYRGLVLELGLIMGLFFAFAYSFDQDTPINIIVVSGVFLTTAAIFAITYTILTIEKRVKSVEFRDAKIEDLIDKFEENRQVLAELKQQQKPDLTQQDKIG